MDFWTFLKTKKETSISRKDMYLAMLVLQVALFILVYQLGKGQMKIFINQVKVYRLHKIFNLGKGTRVYRLSLFFNLGKYKFQ